MPFEFRRVGEPGADETPPWLLLGPGFQFVVHVTCGFLSGIRRSEGIDGPSGYVRYSEIVETNEGDDVSSRRALELLYDAGMVEKVDRDDEEHWRATSELVRQYSEANARRSPTTHRPA